jgi:2-(1,2-epoxy-1,2-dihydrophenyl)acetyl-CoA isomerase
MFFTGDLIDADEAARIGLVNKVVDDRELLATTMAMAKRIASMPHLALGYTKKNLATAEVGDFATSIDMEAFNQARCSQMEDHREAVLAFKEKRKPVFTGR